MNFAFVLAVLLLLAGTGAAQEEEKKYDMKVIQLVFLNEPDNPPKLAEKENGLLQMKHLEFLQGLWEKRTALLVGPLMNAGKMRGIVLLDVDSKEKAEEIMKSDAYVGGGHLVTEIRPIFIARNVPQKGPKFMDLESLWFGLLVRPDGVPKISEEESKKIQEGHMANINRMAESGDLVIAGPFVEDTPLRGIFIFRTKDKAKVEELASNDPAIQQKRFELKLYQWFTAKGTFPEKG